MKRVIWIVISCIVLFGIAQFYIAWYKHEQEIVALNGLKAPNAPTGQEKNKIDAVETFDPNEGIDNSTEILKGSYPIEDENGKKQAWVRKSSEIILKAEEGKDLHIQGYVPVSFHKKANVDLKEVELNVLVNGALLKKVAFQEDKSFDITLDETAFKDLIKGSDFEVELQTNSDYNPSKIQNSNDNRDLAMIINYIGLK